jgi:hypothetical protein
VQLLKPGAVLSGLDPANPADVVRVERVVHVG